LGDATTCLSHVCDMSKEFSGEKVTWGRAGIQREQNTVSHSKCSLTI
jgi:hypothetical protein